MFRHEALRPLSRRHQGVLLFARDLKYHLKALREDRDSPHPDVVAKLLAFWPVLQRHFEAEETLLVPRILDAAPDGHPALDRLRRDHARVRELVTRLQDDTAAADDLDLLQELRDLLHDHTRDEERVLYPFAEEILGPERLAAIERDLDAYVV